jgi:esterase/lipase
MRPSTSVLLLSLLFVLGLTACGSNGLTLLDSIGIEPVSPTGLTTSSLGTGSYVDAATITRNYELLKLEHGTDAPTFVQWIPNASSTTAGAVLLFMPYEGINWSALTIDADWFAKGAGPHPDIDEPAYDPFSSSDISYASATPQVAAAEGFPYSYNGLHVLIVYGRFYTGQNAQNDIEDVKNGLRFLQDNGLVDKTNIGITSGSWGGAGVFYSVAQLGASFMPKAISTLYPVSDFKKLVDYINVTVPSQTVDQNVLRGYATFFDPYYRRIDNATAGLAGQPTRYDSYRQSQLASITSNVFVAHDDWDTLVPVSSTTDLLTTLASADKTSFLQRHSTPIVRNTFTLGHSQASEGMDYVASMSWNYTFLITQLTSSAAPRTLSYSSVALDAQMAHVVAKNAAGNSTFYNKVLNLLCQTNLLMKDSDVVNADMSGPDLLMTIMNTSSPGWAVSGAAACAKLLATPPF